jgi:tRNA-specific 2-thiouridylase
LFVRENELHEVRPGITPSVGTSCLDFGVRYRYRATLEPAECTHLEEGMLVEFQRPQRGIASGQFAAWYADDEVIGSGPIAW